MNKLDKLFDLAAEENISIQFVDSIPGYRSDALYISKNGYKIIAIINSLKNNILKLTEVLSEELGHHFTSTGYNVSPSNYHDKVCIDKCENKALRWACDFLVPKNELIDALKNNYSIDSVSEYLCVSEDVLMQSLYYLSLNNEYLHIEGNRYLILTNYPSVYIYENI